MAEASTYRRNPRLADCIVSDHRNLDALDTQLQSAVKEGNKLHIKMVLDAFYVTQLLRVETDMGVLLPKLTELLGAEGEPIVSEATKSATELMSMLSKIDKSSPGSKEQIELAQKAVTASVEYGKFLEEKALPVMQRTATHAQMLAIEKERCSYMYSATLTPKV